MASKRKADGKVTPVTAPPPVNKKSKGTNKAGGIGAAPVPVEPKESKPVEGDGVEIESGKKGKGKGGKRGRKPAPALITIAPEEAAKIRSHLKAEIREEGDKTLSLGRDLAKVVDGKLYSSWGFKNFKDYVLSELDFQPRSANSLISMARCADVLGQTRPDADEKVKEIGKVKLMALAGLITPDNLTEIHTLAITSSVRDVQKYAKANRKKKDDKPSDVVNRSFKLAPDQDAIIKEALDLAASLADGRAEKTASPGACLETMALVFIATHSGDPTKFAEIASKIEESLGVQIVISAEGELLYGNPDSLKAAPAAPAESPLSSTDLDIA